MTREEDSEELAMFRDSVRRFAVQEIAPNVERWESDENMPKSAWRTLGEAGLLCVDIPEQYGGAGATAQFSAAVIEELIYANCTALAGLVAVHSDMVAHYILTYGTEDQKSTYLPAMASGECVSAIAMSEPAAGSDLQGMRATAVQDNGHFLINGSKTFITNGQHADLVIVAARTKRDGPASQGMSLLLVESDSEGFSRGQPLEKIGLHSADTADLFFDGVRVSTDAVLGELDRGFAQLMTQLPRERWIIAISAVAAVEAALQLTVEYVRDRKLFGTTLSKMQNTRYRVAEMQTDLAVHRAFVDACTAKILESTLDTTGASMAKLACTEMQGRVMDGCLQLFGGYGYMREYPIARAYVDARVQRIYGGTSEIMKEIISRSLLQL